MKRRFDKLKKKFLKSPKSNTVELNVDENDDSSLNEIYSTNKDILTPDAEISDSNISDVYSNNKQEESDSLAMKTALAPSNTDTTSFLHKVPSFYSDAELNELPDTGPVQEDGSLMGAEVSNDSVHVSSVNKPNYTSMRLRDLIQYSDCAQSDSDEFDMNLLEFRKPTNPQEFNREHWLVSKLIRYLKTGNPTATYIALSILRDLELNRESTMYSLINTGAVLVLVNLLTTNDLKCQCGSMQILKVLSLNKRMAFEIIKEGGINALILNLNELDDDAKCLAAECLVNLCSLSVARTLVRKQNGIHRLITLLGFSHVTINQKHQIQQLTKFNRKMINMQPKVQRIVPSSDQGASSNTLKNYELIRSVGYALYALSKDTINHYIMLKHGLVILLSNIIKNEKNEKAIYWLIALLDNCAVTRAYVVAIIHENLTEHLIKWLYETKDLNLQNFIVGIFSKCSEEGKFTALIKKSKCLELLCKMNEEAVQSLPMFTSVETCVVDSEQPQEKLIRNIAGTLAGCCITSPDLLEYFNKSRIIDRLVSILKYYEDQNACKVYFNDVTVVNITRTLSVAVYLSENRIKLLNLDAIRVLVNLLKTNNDEIIKNTCYILGLCCLEEDCLKMIADLDGLRLIWSLLRNQVPEVQEAACWLIYVSIARIKNFGELVRNLSGGIELLLNLVGRSHYKNISVLAYACAAISKIAIDDDNLAVMTDYKVVEKLINLTLMYYDLDHENNKGFLLLKIFLAEAVAQCSRDVNNSYKFGKEGIVEPLVKCLVFIMNKEDSIENKAKTFQFVNNSKQKSKKPDLHYCPSFDVEILSSEIHNSLLKALKELSNNTLNCYKMYKHNILDYLLDSIGSNDEQIQRNSAICLKNIRKLIQRAKDKCLQYNRRLLLKSQVHRTTKAFKKKFSFENIDEKSVYESQSEDEDLDLVCRPSEECECKILVK